VAPLHDTKCVIIAATEAAKREIFTQQNEKIRRLGKKYFSHQIAYILVAIQNISFEIPSRAR
jgi:hypothetical protein